MILRMLIAYVFIILQSLNHDHSYDGINKHYTICAITLACSKENSPTYRFIGYKKNYTTLVVLCIVYINTECLGHFIRRQQLQPLYDIMPYHNEKFKQLTLIIFV